MTSYLGFGFPGGWEMWIILAIFLLLFGHRIPGMARAMGSGIVEFKKGLKDPDGGDKASGVANAEGSDASGGKKPDADIAEKRARDWDDDNVAK